MSKLILFPCKCFLVDWEVGVSSVGGSTRRDHGQTTRPVPGGYCATAGSASPEVQWGYPEPAQSEWGLLLQSCDLCT